MNVPNWVNDYIAYWKPLLFLQEWTIKTEIVDKLEHDDDFACIVETDHVYLRATIKILDTVPQSLSYDVASYYDRETWEKNILHELIHIRLAKLNEFARECITNGFSFREGNFLHERLRVEDENATVILTETIFQLDRQLREAMSTEPADVDALDENITKDPDKWIKAEGSTDSPIDIYVKEGPSPAQKWQDFDSGNMIVPPPDMSADIKAWEDNLRKSSRDITAEENKLGPYMEEE